MNQPNLAALAQLLGIGGHSGQPQQQQGFAAQSMAQMFGQMPAQQQQQGGQMFNGGARSMSQHNLNSSSNSSSSRLSRVRQRQTEEEEEEEGRWISPSP